MPEHDTGYQNREPPNLLEDYPKIFDLKPIRGLWSQSKFPCQLTRNGEPIGTLHLDNEQDFHWLQKRIYGRRSGR